LKGNPRFSHRALYLESDEGSLINKSEKDTETQYVYVKSITYVLQNIFLFISTCQRGLIQGVSKFANSEFRALYGITSVVHIWK
jgi:hypothetical protein